MKRTLLSIKTRAITSLVILLMALPIWGNDGDTFTEETVEGVMLTYTIISESEKTCMVGEKYYPEVPTAPTRRIHQASMSQLSGDITIPEVANGYSVIRIEAFAFEQASITSIVIPNSVKTIGSGAFFQCAELKFVKLPNQLTEIEDETFCNCVSLTSIDIPEGVTSIGYEAFYGCRELKEANIPSSVVHFGSGVFCYAGFTSMPKLPETLTTIPYAIFQSCPLTSVEIPQNITSIEGCAFNDCLITEVEIPAKVTHIGVAAFARCRNLSSIVIPDNVKDIELNAFMDCSNLKTATLSNNLSSLSEGVFRKCASLDSIVIPNGVKKIGLTAFSECKSLRSISIPKTVDSIDEMAFYRCSSLSSIIIPNNLNYIGSGAFRECSGLTSITLGSNVNFIGALAFLGCKKLSDVYCYAEKVPETQDKVFLDTNIENITLHVPAASVSAYQAAEPWKNFKEIVALSDQGSDTNNSDYIPFVELGKQWHVVRSVFPSNNPFVMLEQYMLNEEVVKDGKTYLKLHRSEGDMTVIYDAGLFREENRRVYKYDEIAGKETMLYDFSLKEGDIFTYEDFNPTVKCKVLKLGWLEDGPKIALPSTNPTDTLDFNYRRLRTWTIGVDNGAGEYVELITWVEGVGALENLFCPFCTGGGRYSLAYIERKDAETDYDVNNYLPFSFYNRYGPTHGCNLPTGAENNEEDEWSQHHLTYELEGDRLHVYGDVFTQCGPNNYAYFIEKTTDDPMVRKIEFKIQEVTPVANCMALHATNFYVPGFDPNLNYIVVDNQGEEHPVINKTPQNEYRPFIEDGKVWTVYACSDANPDMEPWREYFYFAGDTIVGGQTCKQMKKIRNASEENWVNGVFTPANSPQEYVGAWYEQDKKVYFARAGKDHPELFYDFTLCSNDTIYPFGDPLVPLVVNKISGGLPGFKGTYYEFRYDGQIVDRWLEGVGNIYHPAYNITWTLDGFCGGIFNCRAGDEVIYYNIKAEDPYVMNARKRFDFTHTTKSQPKIPKRRSEEEQSLYGEYNNLLLDINLDPLSEAYLVRITDETGKVVYEKAINAGSIVALNIDISAYAAGRYTVTVENSQETFTGEFDTQTTGIRDALRLNNNEEIKNKIYNLQGQRLSSLQRGLNIVNGQKVYVK